MTVKALLKHYSMASEGKIIIHYNNGMYTYTKEGVKDDLERDIPLFKHTLGLIKVKNGDLIITAY